MYKNYIFICVFILIIISVFILNFTGNLEVYNSPILSKDGRKIKANQTQDIKSTKVKKSQSDTQSKSLAISRESCKNFVLKGNVKTCLIDQPKTQEVLQNDQDYHIDTVMAEDAFSDEQIVPDEMTAQMTPYFDDSKTTEVFDDIPK